MYLTIFGKPRYLGLVVAENEIEFQKGDQLLVESSRGLEIALIAGEVTERQEALYRSIDNRQEGQSNDDSGLQNVTYLRRALPEDFEKEKINRVDEEAALITARRVQSRHDLNMKLVDVEYMNDRKKLFLYFTSEQRVDFRAYVRDLAREFRTRIELRQIGVRDESKVVKGLGACGRVCCCSYWLQRFMPIGIKMVKEQNLALNPTKISGLCGRLMCCMSYEQNTYHELWKNLPSHGAKIKTEQGTWVLTGVDLAAGTCSVQGPEGTVNIPVSLYKQFKETLLAGNSWSNEEHGLDEKGRSLKAEDNKFSAAPCGKKCPGAPCGQFSQVVSDPPAEMMHKDHATEHEVQQKNFDEGENFYHRRRPISEAHAELTREAEMNAALSVKKNLPQQRGQNYSITPLGNTRDERGEFYAPSAPEKFQRATRFAADGEDRPPRENFHRPFRRPYGRRTFAGAPQRDSNPQEKGKD